MPQKRNQTNKNRQKLAFLTWLRRTRRARFIFLVVAILGFSSAGYAAVQHGQAQSSGWGRLITQSTGGAVASSTVNMQIIEREMSLGDIKSSSYGLPFYGLYPEHWNDFTYRLTFVAATDLGSKPMEFSHWRLFSADHSEQIVSSTVLNVKRSELNTTNIFLVVKQPSTPSSTPSPGTPQTAPTSPQPTVVPAPAPIPKTATPPSSVSRQTVTQPGAAPTESDDVTPLLPPGEFTAMTDESGNILLAWSASEDENGVSHYVLERSLDRTTWEMLNDSLIIRSYVDSEVDYQTEYFYRLHAVDYENNSSTFVETSAITLAFAANVTVREGGRFSTQGEWMTVVVPPEAVSEDAQCSVVDKDELVSVENSQEVFAGPYEIVCKTASGTRLVTFLKPASVSVLLDPEIQDKYRQLTFQALDDERKVLVAEFSESSATFNVQNGLTIVGIGTVKTMPLLLKLLLILIGTIITGLCVLYALYVIYRRQETARYSSYYRKQYGL